ncbi:MAG: hypothetical protein AB1Z98_02100, partial [Nannocystaceae bacterium]
MRALRLATAVALGLLPSCGEGLPEIALKLSKNCNDLEVVALAPQVAAGPGERVLDVAADSGSGQRAWVLLRRPDPDGGDDRLLVQQHGPQGIERELALDLPADVATGLSLRPDPEPDRVWVFRDQPGELEVTSIAPDDPVRPVLGSDNLVGFPQDDELCAPCDSSDWPRELVFLTGGPALVSVPPFSVDAGLIVWVSTLSTDSGRIRATPGQRLNFEPPCLDDSPEGQSFCEQARMSLTYPEITVLGVQQDPRQAQTVLFGHRVRTQTYDGDDFPIESADVFMVSLFLDDSGVPAGLLRSYSGFYFGPSDGPIGEDFAPVPTADPPYGVAIDRFAAYGLFSNAGVVPRLVQLPNADPDFSELTARADLDVDISLLQMDRDLALGRLQDGRWELTKLFPDDPVQSGTTVYETDAPITTVVSGGLGTFMLLKDGAPPEVVRL